MRRIDNWIVFDGRTLFKAMVQDFGDVRLRKSPEAVKNARFNGERVNLVVDHDEGRTIGEVRNMRYVPTKWLGDVWFDTKRMTPEQVHKLQSGQVKELSIGYRYKLEPSQEADVAGVQTDIQVEHVAWVAQGRCGSACALDTTTPQQWGYDTVVLMTDCEEKIEELKQQLKGNDAALEAKVKELQTALDSATAELEEYRAKERAGLIEEVVKVSGYGADELKNDSLADLRLKLEVLSKGKDSAKPAYPNGKPVESKPMGYDPWGSNDLSVLRAKQESA